MGAGTFAAGTAPAGNDAPVGTSTGLARSVPQALRYDGANRDFLLDTTQGTPYQYASVHPVDQLVALRLQVRRGTVRGAPLLGSAFHLIPLDDRAVQATRDEATALLADLVQKGDVRVVAITVQVHLFVTGSLAVQVDYVNLRTSGAESATNVPGFTVLQPAT